MRRLVLGGQVRNRGSTWLSQLYVARYGSSMNIHTVTARLCAEDLVPPRVLQRIADRSIFLGDIARYVAMDDDNLLQSTRYCLSNVDRLLAEDEESLGPDARLRIVLVPELCERLRSSSRDTLRRISTSLAEYAPDPNRPSFWHRSPLWSAERRARLNTAATQLREDIACMAGIDVNALVEQTRFAIVGSRVAETC